MFRVMQPRGGTLRLTFDGILRCQYLVGCFPFPVVWGPVAAERGDWNLGKALFMPSGDRWLRTSEIKGLG